MKQHYEIIVLGAGPAGIACGITLQKAGANVCVVDKASFPRSKTCVGLVTHKTWRLIRTLLEGSRYPAAEKLEALFCDRTRNVMLFDHLRPLATAPIDPEVRLVNRRDFDNALVEEYTALGGTLLEGQQGVQPDIQASCLKLRGGETLHYDALVFADGALSQSRKLLGLDPAELAFGIETYVPAERFPLQSINLYFGYTPSGYIWAFPHGDTVCVGAVDRYQKHMDYRKILTPFLSDAGVDPAQAEYIGAFLPYGSVVPQEKLPGNVLLAGDAAGLADPISGEGLYMALQSGICAGEALQKYRIDEAAAKAAYLKSIAPLQQVVRDGRKLQSFFYRPATQKLFLRKVSGNQKFISFFFNRQVSEYGYHYRHMMKLYRDYKRS